MERTDEKLLIVTRGDGRAHRVVSVPTMYADHDIRAVPSHLVEDASPWFQTIREAEWALDLLRWQDTHN